MFAIGDLVIHCREGLSQVTAITKMGDFDYYLVKSRQTNSENIYVPVKTAEKIIRHLLSPEEADELLKEAKGIKADFNTNTKQRRDAYKRRLSSGDVHDIIYLSRQLHFYNQLGEGNDVIHLGPVDIDMLSYADNMLMDELALTYNINRSLINEFIAQRIEKF